jgi:alpha-tubulin suppressor-like RCC1 family protein
VVYGGLTWSVIRPGGDHTCGLTTTGTAYCWGNGVDGELGDGTSGGYKRVRTLVSGGLTFSALSLGANGYHTCGRVATQVWCWGWNGNGQLGDGSQTMRTEPVQIVQ